MYVLSRSVLSHSFQSLPTLFNPMGYNLALSSVHGDSPGKNARVGCHALLQGFFLTQGSNPGFPHCSWILYHVSHQRSPGILEWIAVPFPGDLPDPGIEPGSPALQAILYQLSYHGSPFLTMPYYQKKKKGKQGLKGRHTIFPRHCYVQQA